MRGCLLMRGKWKIILLDDYKSVYFACLNLYWLKYVYLKYKNGYIVRCIKIVKKVLKNG